MKSGKTVMKRKTLKENYHWWISERGVKRTVIKVWGMVGKEVNVNRMSTNEDMKK